MRLADENLLRNGNFTEVPSVDVLKNIGNEYNQQYRFDEDLFKEVRVLRYLINEFDDYSEEVRGKCFF
jgi:hypothetical protein